MKNLNFRHFLLAMLLIVLLCAGLLNAYNFGRNAFASGDYNSARRWYQVAAVLGNAKAQNNLAGLYAEGHGGEKNDALAAKWFERAAEQGVSAAKVNLSNFYEEGRGVARDTGKAVALLESAATAGDVVAAFNLGSIFATGREDFPKNAARAIFWYEKAAARAL